MATLGEFLAAFENVRRSGDGYVMRCKAHDDRQNSLSVKQADGKILVHCFADCTAEAVVAAAGLTLADLFIEPRAPDTATARLRRSSAAAPVTKQYEIRDHAGQLVAIHERHDLADGKQFVWKRADGTTGLNGTPVSRLPLWGSELVNGWDVDKPVVVTEGERAAEAVREAGFQVVATVCGAQVTPDPDPLAVLIGRDVVLWADNDDLGRQHMQRVGARVADIASSVRWVDWPDAPEKGDAANTDQTTIASLVAAAPPFTLPGTGLPLASLLADVEHLLRRFISFQNTHQSAACALWVAHCHAIDAAPMAAYLRITSAVEESGKTTLVELLEAVLGDRAVNAVSATPASIFRYRDSEGAVALLLDEIDNTLKDRKDDSARDLMALVNAGYRRSATVLRVVGRNHAPRKFAAFGPCAIAGLGSLHPTTESRCIPIVLERKPQASLESWISFRHEDEIGKLHAALAEWAVSAVDTLRGTEPARPDGMRDRHFEGWWGMFTIADAAGGDWGDRARTAAVALHAGRDEEAVSLGVLLLRHIRQVFTESNADRMATAELLDKLVANEEGPWGRWWGTELRKDGPPRAAAADLATKLRPFGVKPHVVRVGEVTARGYLVDDFAKPFGLYLPPVTDVTGVTDRQSRNQDPVTGVTSVTSGNQTEEPGQNGGPAPLWGTHDCHECHRSAPDTELSIVGDYYYHRGGCPDPVQVSAP